MAETRIFRIRPGESLPPEELREAAAAVREGALIAFPTDTVYGLGTSGLLPQAARRIFELKGRDSRKALPILVHSSDAARRWVEWTPAAQALAESFWPGPLTLVLRAAPAARPLCSTGAETVAVRVPAHPAALALLEASGAPWASSSANLSGSPALTEGADVVEAFSGKIEWIVDAGPTGGTESTVVDLSGGEVRVLREGSVPRAQVLDAVPYA